MRKEKPFQFANGSEIAEAIDILSRNTSLMSELLDKQLIGTHLNYAAGRCLTGYEATIDLLIAYAEHLACNHDRVTRSELGPMKNVMNGVNSHGRSIQN